MPAAEVLATAYAASHYLKGNAVSAKKKKKRPARVDHDHARQGQTSNSGSSVAVHPIRHRQAARENLTVTSRQETGTTRTKGPLIGRSMEARTERSSERGESRQPWDLVGMTLPTPLLLSLCRIGSRPVSRRSVLPRLPDVCGERDIRRQ